MERALLVTIRLASEKDNWQLDDIAQELEELCHTSGVEVVDNISCLRDKPTPNFLSAEVKPKK